MSLNPLPVQGYADGIVIATHNELTSQEIIHASEPIMHKANLDIKASKYGVFYERPSRNNWYKGKHDKKPKITIQNKQITVSKRKRRDYFNLQSYCRKTMYMSTPINL